MGCLGGGVDCDLESSARPDPELVLWTPLAPIAVQAAVQAAVHAGGLPCGALRPAGPPSKRQVLTDGNVLVRVSPSGAVVQNTPEQEVAWARRIGAVVPAQQPLTEPRVWGNWTVTVWQWLDGAPAAAEDAGQHGFLLRRLHDRAAVSDDVPGPVDPLVRARIRLPAIPDRMMSDRLGLMLDVAARVLADADDGCEVVVTHGDAHDRNVLVVGSVPHLLDFDSAGLAYRHVDVASGVYAWRLNHRDEHAVEAFLAGYGTHPDVSLDKVDALVWVRRLRATCTRAAAGRDVAGRLTELERTMPSA